MLKSVLLAAALIAPGMAAAQTAKLPAPVVSETLSIARKSVEVKGSGMAYLEAGTGEPVLFIHGNPTSSYLWRNIIPHVSDTHRAIAVDLIGMGASDKPRISYSYADHYSHLAAFIETLDLRDVTLVLHDWGAALGWDYARQNPGRIKRVAFMEGVLPPAFPVPDIKQMGKVGEALAALRSEKGEEMVVNGNMFVEQLLPGFVNRPLGPEAMAAYRAPYLVPESRRPTLAWPRQLPIEGKPAETAAMMEAVAAFMAKTSMPVLALYADPGVIGPPAAMAWYKARIRNLETVYVGQGLHFIQEDQPDAIGRAIDDWLRRR